MVEEAKRDTNKSNQIDLTPALTWLDIEKCDNIIQSLEKIEAKQGDQIKGAF